MDRATRRGPDHRNGYSSDGQYRDNCGKCGARRIDDQIGLEASVEEYVAKMVQVFGEVKRVLRDEGTLWLNLGPTYCGKQLVAIPWLVALALQADGWILRQEIIWNKPAPMPESVQDRCTKAHEQIFLLAKQPRYFYDQDAIRERNGKEADSGNYQQQHGDLQPANPERTKGMMQGKRDNYQVLTHPLGRNKRTVWTIPSESFPGLHFATFPRALVRPCVLAGTSRHGCCGRCGAPWRRIVDKPQPPESLRNRSSDTKMSFHTQSCGGGQKLQDWYDAHPPRTVNWCPSCTCNAGIVPATVLDPFCGSGTTGLVSLKLGRSFVGIELNPQYVQLSLKRLKKVCGGDLLRPQIVPQVITEDKP